MISIYLARRLSISTSLLALALLAIRPVTPAEAQYAAPPSKTPLQETSPLHPPAGARVAIVEFDDQECPLCARDNSILKAAAAKYNIPWVRHDFPLKMHAWSFQAAVNARWFDTRSKKLGDDYRDQVFANQPNITSLDVLRTFTEKFAANQKLALPFAIDPEGKLTALVKADYALGQKVGIEHTPTIWVSTSQSRGAPFVEVVDRTKLFQLIDQALADTKAGK